MTHSTRGGRVRWLLAGLMFLGGIINYMDRAALSVMAPFIEKDLGLSATQMGVVFSSFFLGYAVFCFVGGLCADRFGPRRTLAGAMGLWSIFCGLTAAVTGFASLVTVRVLFGMGEGPLGTTNNKTIKNWFPRREAASATGFVNAGQPLGGALCGPIVGMLAISLGWRLAFVVIMVFGLAWMIAWYRFARDKPAQHPDITPAELTLIEGDRIEASAAAATDDAHGDSLWTYIRMPAVLAVAAGYFAYSYVLTFFLTWFPTYLVKTQGLNIREMSFASAVPWLCGMVGLLAGGLVCDMLYRRTGQALRSSKTVVVGGMVLAACGILAARGVTGLYMAVGLMSVTVFFMYCAGTCIWSSVLDLVPERKIGGVGGFIHFVANLAGVVGPTLTGYILDRSGSFETAFTVTGAIALAGAAAVLLFVRPAKLASTA